MTDQICPARRSRLLIAASFAATALACLLGAAGPAQAQTPSSPFVPPVYAVTAKLKPVNGGFLNLFPQLTKAWAINNRGQVVGATEKSAGKVKVATIDQGLYYTLGIVWPGTSTVSVSDTYPVLWEGSVSKVLPRMGANGSWATDILNDGRVVVNVAPIAGPLPAGLYRDPPFESSAAFLKDGRYTPLGVDVRTIGYFVNQSGTVLGFSKSMRRWRISRNGPAEDFAMPFDLSASELIAFSDAEVLVVQTGRWSNGGDGRCFTWSQGVLTELQAPEPGVSVDCRAINASGAVAGFLTRSADIPRDHRQVPSAAFVYKGGRFTVAPVQVFPFGVPDKGFLNASGVFLYDQGVTSLPNGYQGGGFLFVNGQIAALDPLIKPALTRNQYLSVIDFNDAGQVLARVVGIVGVEALVVSPTKPIAAAP